MQAQHTASAAVKLSQFSWRNEFLRKQQSCAVPLRRTDGGEIEDLSAVRAEHGEHGVSRLLLLRLLGLKTPEEVAKNRGKSVEEITN